MAKTSKTQEVSTRPQIIITHEHNNSHDQTVFYVRMMKFENKWKKCIEQNQSYENKEMQLPS